LEPSRGFRAPLRSESVISLFDFGWAYYPEVDELVEALPELLASTVRVYLVIETVHADGTLSWR